MEKNSAYKNLKKIYLDYAASTPVAHEVKRAMDPYFFDIFGNPGSLHSFGQKAMAAVDAARETIGKAIRADFREVIFTSGATEANNLVLRGIVADFRRKHADSRGSSFGVSPRKVSVDLRPRLIVSAIEHESVLDTAYALEQEGIEVVVLPVDAKGIVDLKKLEAALDSRTVLVSVMYVNNEIGSVQPITKISEMIRNFRKESGIRNQKPRIRNKELGIRNGESAAPNSKFLIPNSRFPLFHTDAAQAFEYFSCDVEKLGIDLMTLSSQKIYGPKGAGALYIRNQESGIQNGNAIIPNSRFLIPSITGGGQEFGLRSGTENVSAIAGFGEAARLAERVRTKNAKKVTEMKEYFWNELKKIYPRALINGNQESGIRNKRKSEMAPHILNVYFPTEFAGDLLIKMDMAGIAASSGSACSAHSFTPSHVLEAVGLPSERVRGSVRFSFGTPTTKREIKEALRRTKKILNA